MKSENKNRKLCRKVICFTFHISLFALLFAACGEKPLTLYVNPFVGTDGHGHTFPGAIVPFGQIQPSPDTRLEGWDGCSGYHYSDDTIYGFSHTHLSGTGCEDYGDVLLMPVNVETFHETSVLSGEWREAYKSHFSHDNETAQAGYYKVMLDKSNIIVELTADRRVAYHRYTYADGSHSGFVVDLRHRDVLLSGKVILCGDKLVGWRESSAWNPHQRLAFAICSSIPMEEVVFNADSTQALVLFPRGTKQVQLRVAISGVDISGAIGNLNVAEYKEFDEARQGADSTWEAALGKLRVEGGTSEQKRCFYTALYHCMTAPYLWSDADGRYRGTDKQIHVADEGREVYTVFSLWDTYRALHPLLTQIEPRRTVDFVYTAMKNYEQGGELPMWELAGHETHCMIGYHAVPMMLEAYVYLAEPNGTLAGYTPKQLLEAMVATSNRTPEQCEYARQGYLSSEVDNESVSKTLEYAYDDWCIAQMAEIAGDIATARTYWIRSQSWHNVIDGNGFAHPKRNGAWLTPFDPTEVNNHFTEANSWQYSTYVPHNIDLWMEYVGGREKAVAFLDSLFEGHNAMSGRDQADVTGLIGMYAHGNEPSHHAAWLYNLLGQSEKTEKYVHRILNELYSSKPDGLCGNEDCGQMSAWYVLASLGCYEVCPGMGVWITTKPIFTSHFSPSTPHHSPFTCPDSLHISPCPVFSDWRMQSNRDKVTDTNAHWTGLLPSQTVRHIEVKTQTEKHVTYLTQPAPQYTENGPEGMVDRIFGTPNYRIGGWQGWQSDMVAVVEMEKEQTIRSVGVDCLENMRSWIFFPKSVSVEYSMDGRSWKPFGEVKNTGFAAMHTRQEECNTFTFAVKGSAHAKYVKVRAQNYGPLPDWHVSAGEQAWIFVDEIVIK